MVSKGAQADIRLCSKILSAPHKGGQRQQQTGELKFCPSFFQACHGSHQPTEAPLHKLRWARGHRGNRNPNYGLLSNKVQAHPTETHYWQSEGCEADCIELWQLYLFWGIRSSWDSPSTGDPAAIKSSVMVCWKIIQIKTWINLILEVTNKTEMVSEIYVKGIIRSKLECNHWSDLQTNEERKSCKRRSMGEKNAEEDMSKMSTIFLPQKRDSRCWQVVVALPSLSETPWWNHWP